MTSLDKVDEDLKCVYLRWATAGSAEKSTDIEEKRESRDALAEGERLELVRSRVLRVHCTLF